MRNLLFIRIYYSLSATMATHSEGNESRDMTKCETWGKTLSCRKPPRHLETIFKRMDENNVHDGLLKPTISKKRRYNTLQRGKQSAPPLGGNVKCQFLTMIIKPLTIEKKHLVVQEVTSKWHIWLQAASSWPSLHLKLKWLPSENSRTEEHPTSSTASLHHHHQRCRWCMLT